MFRPRRGQVVRATATIREPGLLGLGGRVLALPGQTGVVIFDAGLFDLFGRVTVRFDDTRTVAKVLPTAIEPVRTPVLR